MIPSTVRSRISVLNLLRRYNRNTTPEHRSAELLSDVSLRSGEQPPHTESQELVIQRALDGSMTLGDVKVGGIDWDVAGLGTKIWLSARARAESRTSQPAVLRSMHIDALRYMNMALPADLTEVEAESIRASLPSRLHGQHDGQTLMSCSRPNALRQGVAQAVCWLMALLFVVVPLLMTALNRALIYEREHRLLERVVGNSIEITKSIGEKGLVMGDTLIKIKDTPLGQVSVRTSAWLIEGFVGGFNDGLVKVSRERASLVASRSSTVE